MSRSFNRQLPRIQCDRNNCMSSALLPIAARTPERKPNTDMDAYRTALWAAFTELAQAALPEGWLRQEGGGYYLKKELDREHADDPEFCSLNCARLWLMARLKPAKKEKV